MHTRPNDSVSHADLPRPSLRSARAAAGLVAAVALAAAMLPASAASASPARIAVAAPATVAAAATAPSRLPAATAVDSSGYAAGSYIVTLAKPSAATYAGGISGYAATKPRANRQLNDGTVAVRKYSALLERDQDSLTDQLDVTPLYSYTLAANGFAASLTAQDAARLAQTAGVVSVVPTENLSLQGNTTDFLKLSGAGGVWESIGGTDQAGAGVVVGMLDTGISPENPSFAGDALDDTASETVPYLDGNVITFDKADGGVFTSTREAPSTFAAKYYSTKIIGAHYFVDGFGTSNIGGNGPGVDTLEYLSPRDGHGHGSHTASTAAGAANVAARVDGTTYSISGVAPAAKIAAYKVCWTGKYDDGCNTADIVAGIEQAVVDGVDVLSYSIGGGPAQTVYSPIDEAFMGAASAGIFVSVAGGNAGPDASSLDNAAPWETTVAASTYPDPWSSKKTKSPQIASFSSRGPVLAAGSDVLKPDIAAPGVDVIAAVASTRSGKSQFEAYSGTSMATPHISGLAAIYLGEHPLASPAEIKSAMLTTAKNTVTDTGKAYTNPFAQGSGQVTPINYLEPSLVYLNDADDWKSYLVGAGEADFAGVEAIDPSDLNLPSIAIGQLPGIQTVTRELTAVGTAGAGTYTATASIPGVRVTVSPATLTFDDAGVSKPFTVTFTRTSAKLNSWATGFLTWTKTGSTSTVRSPLAVRPVLVSAVPAVSGSGTGGEVTITAVPGTTKKLPVVVAGLAARVDTKLTSGTEHDGVISESYEEDYFLHTVKAGVSVLRFDLQTTPTTTLDDFSYFAVYFKNKAAFNQGNSSGSYRYGATNDEGGQSITVTAPKAGIWATVIASMRADQSRVTYTEASYQAKKTGAGNLTPSVRAIQGAVGSPQSFDLRWGGLKPQSSYLGFVGYDTSATPSTLVTITTGDPLAPVAIAPPVISGAQTGKTATVSVGSWDAAPADLDVSYQWFSGDEPIVGATAASYAVPADAFGDALRAQVTAALPGGPAVTVDSTPATVASASTTTVKLSASKISAAKRAVATVTVTAPEGSVVGTVTVRYGTASKKHTKTVMLTADSAGVVKVKLPKLAKKKTYTVTATFNGSPTVGASKSAVKKLKVV